MLAFSRFRYSILLLTVLGVLSPSQPAVAEGEKKASPRKAEPPKPADFQSQNFLIHTDLPAKEAKELLDRLEDILKLISRYWGRRNPRTIECYVVKDLKNWPAAKLQRMHPNGLAKIRSGAGVTITQVQTLGAKFRSKAIVYAIATRGVPQHEAVHAYCGHAFGRTGPVWYSEGMAEMGQYWLEKDPSVNCHDYVARYLTKSDPKELSEIVEREQMTGDSWQNYAWRWALCHLLANNSNYASRFRPLGLGLLTKRRTSFKRIYGSMAKEINFEYHFFLKHLGRGYRVDLCSWDWKTSYRPLRGTRFASAKVNAKAGWQPSRVKVTKGVEYEYSVTGSWKTTKSGDDVSPDGDENGAGKLVGVLFNDYKLSEPFELGAFGSFKAPGDGQLLLRCKDDWTRIADNKGRVSIRLKIKGNGKPLAKPVVKKKRKVESR